MTQFETVFIVSMGLLLPIGLIVGIQWARERWARMRAPKRAPIADKLLRAPAESLRQQLGELNTDLVFEYSTMIFMPAYLFSICMVQIYWVNAANTLLLVGIYTLGCFVFIANQVRKLIKLTSHRNILRLGHDAELATGQELNQLMRHGAYVYHDVPFAKFNIDHVVVCATGVYAVETKGVSKADNGDKQAHVVEVMQDYLQFPTWRDTQKLSQAKSQARSLSQWLGAVTGTKTAVVPVLALPGWLVKHRVKPSAQVKILNLKQAIDVLIRNQPSVITQERIISIAYQLEMRCRDVEIAPVTGSEGAFINQG